MSGSLLNAVRGLSLGERSRRETLRLLGGAGVALAGFAAHVNAEAAPGNAPQRKPRKKKFKGDPRCKHRKALSLKGVCIGSDPDTTFPAQCTAECFCVADHRRSRRMCVQVACEQQCAADDDCPTGASCANVAGCCLDHPEYKRTCVTPCPPA